MAVENNESSCKSSQLALLLQERKLQERKSVRMRQASAASFEDDSLSSWSTSLHARAALISIMSALYAVLLVIIALAFEVSILVVNEVESHKYDPFYLYLYIVGLVYLAYCHAFLLRSRGWRLPVPFYTSPSSTPCSSETKLFMKKTYVSHAAKNAGSLYLRLGAIVFGIVGIMDRGIQIFGYLDNALLYSCYNDALRLVEDILFIIFIFVQLYFIFQNSRLVIHRLKHFGRFGFMHLVATNLCIWIRRIVSEEFSVMRELEKNIQHEAEKSNRSIENTGRLGFVSRSHEPVVMEQAVECTRIKKTLDNLLENAKPFMATCTIEHALICAAVMYILWRNVGREYDEKFMIRKEKLHVDCSSSTKGLFAGLIFVMFSIISMVVFFTKIQREENGQALWVMYLSDIILYIVSIFAVVYSMISMRKLSYVALVDRGTLLDDILLMVSLVGQLMFCIFSVVALTKWDFMSWLIICVSSLRMIQVLIQTVFILVAQRLTTPPHSVNERKPGREMVTFLLLCNLAMFLINTFETQKSGVNPMTVDFYGRSIWTVIVHSTVPLTIFYRFHSSVCLAEVWKTTYQFKGQGEAV